MIVMPNTQPVIDDAAIVDFILRRARDTALVRIAPMAAITKGLAGELMSEIGSLKEAGAVAVTDGTHAPIFSAGRSPMPRILTCWWCSMWKKPAFPRVS
jgi:dihydroorotase